MHEAQCFQMVYNDVLKNIVFATIKIVIPEYTGKKPETNNSGKPLRVVRC